MIDLKKKKKRKRDLKKMARGRINKYDFSETKPISIIFFF
jgi:hypothetical protein